MFRLARLLGKTVFELKCTITSKELNGWAKYLAQEPSNSLEIQSALIAQVASNALGGKASLSDMLITAYQTKKEANTEAKPMSSSAIKAVFSNLL